MRKMPMGRTFAEFGLEKLAALCGVSMTEREATAIRDVFRLLMVPWGDRPIGAVPAYRSHISDDEAPFEFSIACSADGPEIQVYVEPQGTAPAAAANLHAARALVDVLASDYGAWLDDLRAIESLFLPDPPGPPFSLWVGASWTRGRGLLFKVYLNPHVRGREHSVDLVAAALDRLGFGAAWLAIEPALPLRDGRAEPGLLSLDLSRQGGRRVKLYVRYHGATLRELEAIAGLTREHHPDEVRRFYTTLADGTGPFLDKPPITELVFAEPHTTRPSATTLEFPIARYVGDDEVARQRIERCLRGFGLAPEPYVRAIRAFATRPLDERAGLHSHVTLRRGAAGPRIAIYLAGETYTPERGA